jgi:uncharacterized membrane protein
MGFDLHRHKHRQLAIFGDEGIYKALGASYWDQEVALILKEFMQANLLKESILIIRDIGTALHEKFPYDRNTDKNELPDEHSIRH